MATASRHLCRTIWQISRATPAKRRCISQPIKQRRTPARSFATSMRWRADDSSPPNPSQAAAGAVQQQGEKSDQAEIEYDDYNELPDRSEYLEPDEPITEADLDTDDDTMSRADLTREEKQHYLHLLNHAKAMGEQHGSRGIAERLASESEMRFPIEVPRAQATAQEIGYWGEDEVDEFGKVEDDDDDWDESMMTSVAESQLELHREIRQYMRVTAWDMPLLHKFAKPFEAPTHETPLRFRYTTYMGEFHPAQKKVVVEFSTKDLQQTVSLSEAQRVKLIKLVGVRYNPSIDTVRMSCEKFEHAAQNKRYLGDLVDKLIVSAKDSSDMYEDVPLDFRHHKEKKKPAFPEAWKMTKTRVEELDILRQAPLKQLAAVEELQQSDRKVESEQQKKIAEYMLAQPLGRREPTQRSFDR